MSPPLARNTPQQDTPPTIPLSPFLDQVRSLTKTAPSAALAQLELASVAELESLSRADWMPLLQWALDGQPESAVLQLGRILAWIPEVLQDPEVYPVLAELDDADVLAVLCVRVHDARLPDLFSRLLKSYPYPACYLLERFPHLRRMVTPEDSATVPYASHPD